VQPTDLADPPQNPDSEEPSVKTEETTPETAPPAVETPASPEAADEPQVTEEPPVAEEPQVAEKPQVTEEPQVAEAVADEPDDKAPGRVRRFVRSPWAARGLNVLAGVIIFVALL
jgi:hypothetical protein